jgi:hypothetical protein
MWRGTVAVEVTLPISADGPLEVTGDI